MTSYYCYIIFNENGNTYNGYTTNLQRRLRQHNGEIKGGAKATHNRGPWKFLFVMTSCEWDCCSIAMKHEWTIKYPTRKRPRPKIYNGIIGRLDSLKLVFEHLKKINNINNICCKVIEEYYEYVKKILEDFKDIIEISKSQMISS